ncbi:MAG TPA: hypothetical protein PKK48_08905, partial [Phycisphaerae bacterium]|nr:hypothetical protein [Phycisphaerae bacterium]
MAKKQIKLKEVLGQPSWVMSTDNVKMAISQLGGQLAPVIFFADSKTPVQPYWVAPWYRIKDMKFPRTDTVLKPLRGDFFCLPFGANAEKYEGEQHTCHGEAGTEKWKYVNLCDDGKIVKLTLSMNTKIRKGRIVKDTWLKNGHNAVYQSHELSGYAGKIPLANHHTLAMSDTPESVLVSMSSLKMGFTNPVAGDIDKYDYAFVATNEKFRDLAKVPTRFKTPATCDCSKLPTRKGYGDLVQCFHNPSDRISWVTATYTSEGFMWYSLKLTEQYPAVTVWLFNNNRHNYPWDIFEDACLGLENSCSYLACGLADSVRPNPASRAGFKTYATFSPKTPSRINIIQGVVRVPAGFGKATSAKFDKGKVTFISGTKKAVAKVDWEFLE